ncbi:hypothetical protein HaLaN_05617 [Haematococcus lacustris]|uniref:Uncharacterized protein n=1 Tax=Haematococcus lacustris TaxID=44745 RepID=A0A699YTN8_HAELA|nr:hypothetical protein HaLaN_05617 [Haematococcus lacustris]
MGGAEVGSTMSLYNATGHTRSSEANRDDKKNSRQLRLSLQPKQTSTAFIDRTYIRIPRLRVIRPAPLQAPTTLGFGAHGDGLPARRHGDSAGIATALQVTRRSGHDKLAFAVHAVLSLNGLRLIAVSDAADAPGGVS